MTGIKSCLKLISFSIVLLLAFGIVTQFHPGIKAQSLPSNSSQEVTFKWDAYKPDSNIGQPGRREGGGTRSLCAFSKVAGQTLTALVPLVETKETDNLKLKMVAFGATLESSPNLFFYIPPTAATNVKFSLEDNNKQKIYTTTFAITGDGGILSIGLPSGGILPFLVSNKDYLATFSLSCNTDNLNDLESPILWVNGWIRRVDPDPELVQQLKQATPQDKPAIYTKYGIWYDALNSLVQLRRASPNDANLTDQLAKLLKSAGLTKIVAE